MKIRAFYNFKLEIVVEIIDSIYDENYSKYLLNATRYLLNREIDELEEIIVELKNKKIRKYSYSSELFDYVIDINRVNFKAKFYEDWQDWSCPLKEFEIAMLLKKEFINFTKPVKIRLKDVYRKLRKNTMYIEYYYDKRGARTTKISFDNEFIIGYHKYFISILKSLEIVEVIELLNIIEKTDKNKKKFIEYRYDTELFSFLIREGDIFFKSNIFEDWEEWSCPTVELKRVLLGWKEFLKLPRSKDSYVEIEINDL